jgi:citrate lyase subunit beta/citryl-CoA lyase
MRRYRSILFAPGNRSDLIEKLSRAKPDAVVIDLEDAIPSNDTAKNQARDIAGDSILKLLASKPDCAVFIRINAVSSRWFHADLQIALGLNLTGIVIPKLERTEQLGFFNLEERNLEMIAGIETALGVENVREILQPPITAVYFGAEDFVADMNGIRTPESLEVLYARSQVVLAARVRGVQALDIIEARFRDLEAFRSSAQTGRSLGYSGKMCIHPDQVAIANEVFSPSVTELERAKKLLEAYQTAAISGTGVIEFDGQMIDEPMLARARAMLEFEDHSSVSFAATSPARKVDQNPRASLKILPEVKT